MYCRNWFYSSDVDLILRCWWCIKKINVSQQSIVFKWTKSEITWPDKYYWINRDIQPIMGYCRSLNKWIMADCEISWMWLHHIALDFQGHCYQTNSLSFCCDWLGHGISPGWLQTALKIYQSLNILFEKFETFDSLVFQQCQPKHAIQPDTIVLTLLWLQKESMRDDGLWAWCHLYMQWHTYPASYICDIYSRNIRVPF